MASLPVTRHPATRTSENVKTRSPFSSIPGVILPCDCYHWPLNYPPPVSSPSVQSNVTKRFGNRKVNQLIGTTGRCARLKNVRPALGNVAEEAFGVLFIYTERARDGVLDNRCQPFAVAAWFCFVLWFVSYNVAWCAAFPSFTMQLRQLRKMPASLDLEALHNCFTSDGRQTKTGLEGGPRCFTSFR